MAMVLRSRRKVDRTQIVPMKKTKAVAKPAPILKLTAFAQGAMGCVFKAQAYADGTVFKVEKYSKVQFSEKKIQERILGLPHVASNEMRQLKIKETEKVNGGFLLRLSESSGLPPFFIPTRLALDPEKGCTKLTKARKGFVIVSSGSGFDGDTRALGRSLDLAEFAKQIHEGLDYIHAAGVIHRDIKEENIYYRVQNGAIYFAIGDFGVACFADKNGLSADNMFAGTDEYMTPQMLAVEYENLDEPCGSFAADFYALGMTLIQLWAQTLGLPVDPILAYSKDELTYEQLLRFSELWMGFLSSRRSEVPAELGLPAGTEMDRATKRLISKYYNRRYGPLQ